MGPGVFDSRWLPHQASFYRLAFYILENEDEAKDAVQDLYLKLWAARDTLDSVENPKAYGLHLLRNLCIDRIRSHSRHPSSSLEHIEAAADDSSFGKLAAKEDTERLVKLMGRLPDKQRRILEMRAIEGLEYSEIAGRTGLSNVNVRVTVAMARKSLRKSMKGE